MSDKILHDFKDKKHYAKIESDTAREWMKEEEIAYNYLFPQRVRDQVKDLDDDDYYNPNYSQYFPSDYPHAIGIYTDFMLTNMPFLELEGNEPLSQRSIDQINKNIKKIITTDNIERSIKSIIRRGMRKSVCACELIPVDQVRSGLIVGDDGIKEEENTIEKGHVKLIKYPPEDTFIDPMADPDDIRNTAEYCIIDVELLSVDMFKYRAEQEGWEYEETWLNTGYGQFTYNMESRGISGQNISSRKKMLVSKMFESDGTIKVILNDMYLLKEGLNSKLSKWMPLIFYSSIGGGTTPYDSMLWKQMRQAVMGKGVILSSSLDSIGKNISACTFYGGPDHKMDSNLADYDSDQIVPILKSSPDKPLANDFHRITFPEITQGMVFAIEQFNMDISQITNISSLSRGEQNKQVRTNAIASQLMSPTITKESSYIQQLEDTFFKELGRDFIWIFYAFYPYYEMSNEKIEDMYVPRDILRSIKNVRVKNGSTLPEDQIGVVQKLLSFMEIVLATAEDNFDVNEILMDVAKYMDIPAEKYKLSPMESIIKTLIETGIDPQVANEIATEMLGRINERQQNTDTV